jgi:hypothetical protein
MLKTRNQQIIAGVVFVVLIAVLGIAIFLVLSDSEDSGDTRVILNNTGECPMVILTVYQIDENNNQINTRILRAAPGESDSTSVEPNTVYFYRMEFPDDVRDESDGACFRRDSEGQIDHIPSGRSVTFNAESERREEDE